ncbi:MAG TPA: hypothetical protein PKY77_03445 [Phycisphaerae bacterium]|nr:hypothetical protein [Phycisphaerae bacterium]HRY67347.1 hypothetical protein [Phycisphaerae bacterium]HSA28490.1 hypothetical protein [Phycisphaerae bacterium]
MSRESVDSTQLKTSSQRRIDANRRNAAKSTGPRTPQGKARSRQNACQHGLLAQAILMPPNQPDESLDEFTTLLSELNQQYLPRHPIESLIVQRVAISWWRLRRAYRHETACIMARRDNANHPAYQYAASLSPFMPKPPDAQSLALPSNDDLDKLIRYESMINRQLRHDLRYLETLQKTRSESSGQTPASPEPVDPPPHAAPCAPTASSPVSQHPNHVIPPLTPSNSNTLASPPQAGRQPQASKASVRRCGTGVSPVLIQVASLSHPIYSDKPLHPTSPHYPPSLTPDSSPHPGRQPDWCPPRRPTTEG